MDINKILDSLEKAYQSTYKVDKRLHIHYVNAEAQKALEFLATSKGSLMERIWFAYQHFIINFLWAFDYKNQLSYENQKNWEFLQHELNYKFSAYKREEIKRLFLAKNSIDSIKNYIKHDRYRNTPQEGVPSFLQNIRRKDIKIAKAMFYIIDEISSLARKNYAKK